MQLITIILLVILNGLFAMSEIAVVSARRARLQERIDAGNKGAEVAARMSEFPNDFLSTVQVGITLIGILAGAFGGATVGQQFGNWIGTVVPPLQPYSSALGVGGVVLLTTYLSLVIGELVPKRLGMQYPEAIASAIAIPMNRLSVIVSPLVKLLSLSTNLVLRVIGINPNEEPTITEAEVIHMIREGQDEGVFDPHEIEMVKGVFQLDDKRVDTIMTARPDIKSLSLNDTMERTNEIILNSPHSYYPVCEGSLDHVVGVIKAKDLLTPLMNGEMIDLRKLMRPPLFMPSMTVAARALEMFKSSGVHMAMVVGEHGGIEGVLTINDVLEEIVGDIDADEPEIVQRADGSWLLDGKMELTRFEEFLPAALMLPPEEVGGYRTLAGFVMARLGRLPRIADVFHYRGLRFEVVDMDGARIDRIMVSELADENDE